MGSIKRIIGVLVVGTLLCCTGEGTINEKDGGHDTFYGTLPDGKTINITDTSIGVVDASSTVGTPCPCLEPLQCVRGGCRKPCTIVICNGETDCDPGQTCVNTEKNIPVCVAAGGPGESCSGTNFCSTGHLCLNVGGTMSCHLTCADESATCATGQCLGIPQTTCFACQ